jgi:hypothetical protein
MGGACISQGRDVMRIKIFVREIQREEINLEICVWVEE